MQFIPLGKLSKKLNTAAVRFIVTNEILCVQLSAHFRKSDNDIYAVFADEQKPSEIYGILKIGTTVLHCLPFAAVKTAAPLQENFVKSLASFLLKRQEEKLSLPECVNGTAGGSALIMQAFRLIGKNPRQTNEYTLMKLDTAAFSAIQPYPFMHGEQLVRCKKDVPAIYKQKLLVLQEQYEKEEVVPDYMTFSEDSCRLRLANALRTQYILALELNGQLVSKAATSAIGFMHVQIGGVFTALPFRRRHYSFNTMYALLRKICRMKKQPVLFVKNRNAAAFALYKSLRFVPVCSYTIAYY